MSIWRRLTLQRSDGDTYLDRWGISTRWLTIYVHRISAPDPGVDLHSHPWNFVTIPLWGGYFEWREKLWHASAAVRNGGCVVVKEFRPLRPRRMRVTEAHRIVELRRRTAWSLIVAGPVVDRWGFYTPNGYIDSDDYKHTARRGLTEVGR